MKVETIPPKLFDLIQLDPYLDPFKHEICRRYEVFQETLKKIEKCGGIERFSSAYKEFGLHVQSDGSVSCLEWAPGADSIALVGDFNNWDQAANVYNKGEFGRFALTIPPAEDGTCRIKHGSKLKTAVTKDGKTTLKLSPWAVYVTCPTDSVVYHQEMYNPPTRVELTGGHPERPKSLRIYEAHVGISSPEGKVNTYRGFADDVIPRIAKQGYNCIQLMAVMEHVYYASFGYQVTSFFGASSRCGTPDDLRYLVNKAHSLGLVILLDVVHSHASKNILDGLNEWDGTTDGYFHGSARGYHNLWDSRLFDYTKIEVLRFLLSNLRWWIDEYGFDGFRFDGVTSMIYHSHGMNDDFSGGYPMYFGLNADSDSIVYLTLVNHFLHKKYPFVITIAEEVSGMPALCRPVEEGGQGFDYRLAMAIPDMWIKLLKHEKDEDWDLEKIVHTLEDRRYREGHVAYAESHDQALVGDKTIAFWLMDKEMYDNMSCLSPMTPIIERGLAFHKEIRMLTMALGGEAWLNFIGNEFGHPEWLDFPRVGNGESYHYARRQFNLPDDQMLRYKFLNEWDRSMNQLEEKHGFLHKGPAYVSWKHQGDKVIAMERGPLVFVFNFHHEKSFADYKVGVNYENEFAVALCSDDAKYGGHSRVDGKSRYHTFRSDWADRTHHICVYVPSRSASPPRIDPSNSFIGPPPYMANSPYPDLFYRVGELSDGRVFFTSHLLFPGGGAPSDLTRPSNIPLRPWTAVVRDSREVASH
ncbi:hypothetical protein PENTCL1PPCAC_6327 [Pristionchus entomophagus]|uniref:1,4-alpha-glucan branching enzyme n=1 Tax=Pristionchus entomophagus TaxID=358040 RepID=A0AAV5SNQ7_9BILA|nr:hypothetical protein PENTCL1PPCAC_6327 [Pristionchus entomophagus]